MKITYLQQSPNEGLFKGGDLRHTAVVFKADGTRITLGGLGAIGRPQGPLAYRDYCSKEQLNYYGFAYEVVQEYIRRGAITEPAVYNVFVMFSDASGQMFPIRVQEHAVPNLYIADD